MLFASLIVIFATCHLSDEENGLFAAVRELFARLLAHVRALDRHVTELERQITGWHKSEERSRKLEKSARHWAAYRQCPRGHHRGCHSLPAWSPVGPVGRLVPRQHLTGEDPLARHQ